MQNIGITGRVCLHRAFLKSKPTGMMILLNPKDYRRFRQWWKARKMVRRLKQEKPK